MINSASIDVLTKQPGGISGKNRGGFDSTELAYGEVPLHDGRAHAHESSQRQLNAGSSNQLGPIVAHSRMMGHLISNSGGNSMIHPGSSGASPTDGSLHPLNSVEHEHATS